MHNTCAMHPARAALLAAEQKASSNAAPSGPSDDAATEARQPSRTTQRARVGSLPPDVEEARKARINRELIGLLNAPASSNSGPTSIQGIGLYTHVAAPPSSDGSNANPVFLPIGGPNRIRKDPNAIEAPLDEEVKRVWQKLEAAVNEEEKHAGRNDMSLEDLKERYGVLDAPNGATEPEPEPDTEAVQTWQSQQQFQQALAQLRRISQGAAKSKDAVMSGMDEEGKGETSAAATASSALSNGTSSTTKGNVYDEGRDPRKR